MKLRPTDFRSLCVRSICCRWGDCNFGQWTF